MDLKARLNELARWQPCATPVVSVYLDTEWTDEQQRVLAAAGAVTTIERHPALAREGGLAARLRYPA
jgi:hypothetical protein